MIFVPNCGLLCIPSCMHPCMVYMGRSVVCIGFRNRGNKHILFHPNVLECWTGSVHFFLTAGMLLGVQNHPDTVIKLD